jgi:hypothetical protein
VTYTAESIEAFARWAMSASGGPFNGSAPTGFTLAAAVELASRRQVAIPADAISQIDSWANDHDELNHALRLFSLATECRVTESNDAVWLTLPAPNSASSDAHEFFLRRFREALQAAGFPNGLAYGFAGALEGMTDNLCQHCFDGVHKRGGLAAFRIRRRGMAFVVADLGRGALTSLRENTLWEHLDSDHAAIQAIITRHASRREGLGDGEGFKTLFKTMASHNGDLRFRSGGATYDISGSLDAIKGTAGFSDPIPGLQMSVRCRLD